MQISTTYSHLWTNIRKIGDVISDIVVPPTCIVCSRLVAQQGGCCPDCWQELQFISEPVCPVMGTPFAIDMGKGMLCPEAIADPPPFERLRATMIYDKFARRFVSSLKYSDHTDLAPWMAKWMSVTGKEMLADADMVIPVPLHPARLVWRRFNQSAELARHICCNTGVHYSPGILQRHKRTKQQVGLSGSARYRNVSGAFIVPTEQKFQLKGRRVVLVDDVYTTGATAKAACRELKRAGADAIDVLVFAKVNHHIT